MKSSKEKEEMLTPLKVRGNTLKFFNNLIERRFSEAEKNLNTIRQKDFNKKEEFKEGYIHALEGILLSNRSGDKRDFYNKPNLTEDDISAYKQEFQEFILAEHHTVFDEGYLTAWSDLMHYRLSSNK